MSIAEEKADYEVYGNESDTLKIGIIGDSWVNLHKKYNGQLDTMLTKALGDTIPVSLYSSGKGGAKTKLIYTNMFEEKDINPKTYKGITTSKPVIMQAPQYCIIFGGTNDAVCKMGKDFYAQHIVMIVSHLLKHGIKPIVISIPSVDLDKVYEEGNAKQKLLRLLTMKITGSDFYCLDSYRKQLLDRINEENLTDSILYIDISKISAERGFLGKDGVHPSPKGFRQLDSVIVKTIIVNENRIR